MSAKGYWIAFGVGVAAGATIALLYAPQDGRKTRKQLRRSFDEAGDYLEDAGEYLRERADDIAGKAQKIYHRTRGQVEEAVEKAGSVVKTVSAVM
jgi:gas vesicle protein